MSSATGFPKALVIFFFDISGLLLLRFRPVESGAKGLIMEFFLLISHRLIEVLFKSPRFRVRLFVCKLISLGEKYVDKMLCILLASRAKAIKIKTMGYDPESGFSG
jgi:hypothetical protein